MNHQVRWRSALEKIAENAAEPHAQKLALDALAADLTRKCPDCRAPRRKDDLLVCEPCREHRDHLVRKRRITAREMRERGEKYSQIAQTLSISKQYVQSLLSSTRHLEAMRALRAEEDAYQARRTARPAL